MIYKVLKRGSSMGPLFYDLICFPEGIPSWKVGFGF